MSGRRDFRLSTPLARQTWLEQIERLRNDAGRDTGTGWQERPIRRGYFLSQLAPNASAETFFTFYSEANFEILMQHGKIERAVKSYVNSDLQWAEAQDRDLYFAAIQIPQMAIVGNGTAANAVSAALLAWLNCITLFAGSE